MESWIQQAIDSLNDEEIGGFLFGCGLIGRLNQLPLISPGFLLNFFLKNKNIAICGMILGLGASHIQCFKYENPLLIRRLERIFIIHSGLLPTLSEINQKRYDNNDINEDLPLWVKETINYSNSTTNFIIDYNLCYAWSIITGKLYALCFKFTSTSSLKIYPLLMKFIVQLETIILICEDNDDKLNLSNCFIISNLKNCLACLIIGLSLVFSGTCDSQIKLTISSIRNNHPPSLSSIEINSINRPSHFTSSISGNHGYGFHMALNIATGNGLFTITTSSIENYCMLIISLYPSSK
ncbi:hypothetical protein MXB_4150 [Myxobolus squamalis]|nr:hypothetical protein MXB_4150 [Myxobolus squamalis]